MSQNHWWWDELEGSGSKQAASSRSGQCSGGQTFQIKPLPLKQTLARGSCWSNDFGNWFKSTREPQTALSYSQWKWESNGFPVLIRIIHCRFRLLNTTRSKEWIVRDWLDCATRWVCIHYVSLMRCCRGCFGCTCSVSDSNFLHLFFPADSVCMCTINSPFGQWKLYSVLTMFRSMV